MDKTADTHKLRLFAITWPIFIEIFLHMLMGSVDTFMLSRVSDDAVAAVGVANQILFFAMILFGFVGTGTGVVVAQYLGAKKYTAATQVSALSITLNMLFGVLVSLAVVWGSQFFLSLLQLPTHLMEYADIYLIIVGGSLVVQALLLTVSAIIRTHGFTRDAMFVTLGMNILNIFGNYVLIFGVLGFPQLGVMGVAIATAVSRGVGLVFMFVLLYKRLHVRINLKDYITFHKPYIRKILKIGIPSAGEHVSYQTSQMMITVFITALGTAALATRVYTTQFMMFILLFGLALGQGTQILVGHRVGAGETEEAYKQLLNSLKWSFIITITAAVTFAMLREPLFGIFTSDPDIIALGGLLLLLCIILEPGRTFNLVVISSLRAAGDAQFPVIVGIISMWGLSVPLAYVLGLHLGWGLPGIWLAFIVDEWIRGILMYLRWKSRVWEKKRLVEPTGSLALEEQAKS